MPSADDSSARPKGSGSSKDELAYYKAQYEQLEAELTDFQASSRELEAELEKDIEASEKRERQLKERLDSLRYEVDEWKASFLYLWNAARADNSRRPSTSSLNRKAAQPRTPCRRRSRLCATPTEPYN